MPTPSHTKNELNQEQSAFRVPVNRIVEEPHRTLVVTPFIVSLRHRIDRPSKFRSRAELPEKLDRQMAVSVPFFKVSDVEV